MPISPDGLIDASIGTGADESNDLVPIIDVDFTLIADALPIRTLFAGVCETLSVNAIRFEGRHGRCKQTDKGPEEISSLDTW